MNGIAWDAKGKRLFVTGKKWQKVYQVKLSPIAP
jgi:glutamine cyclotransferase